MSHVVQIQARIQDPAALAAACRRLGLAEPVKGTAQLYSGEATITFDNYEGRWGDQAELGRLLQMYAVEKAKLAARAKGYLVSEQVLDDGAIRLQIIEGNAS
jgi:hypothetical protein